MRLLSDACGGDHQGDEPQVQKQQVQIPKVTIKALERKVDEPITLMQHRAVQFNEVHYDESISASTTKVPQLQSDIEAAEASKVQVQGVLAKHQADRTAAKRPWPRPRRYVGRSGGVRCHEGGSQLEHSSHHEGRRCFGKG